MKKKYGLWHTVKYYYMVPFAIWAIVLAYANDYIFEISCEYMNLTERHPLYHIYKMAVPIGLAALWFIMVFTICRNKRYRYLTGRNYRTDNSKYKRSYHELVEYFQDAEPHKLDTSDFEKKAWRNAKGIIFGTVKGRLIQIPSNSECNVAIFGPPGSGKTSGIAIVNAMSFEGSVLAVDVKGDLFSYVSKHTKRKIVRFCPDSPTALKDSVRFDPFAEIEQMDDTDKKLYLESVATVLIADEGGSDGNYFSTRARKMFQGITHLMLHSNPNASFPDVIHAILQGNVFDWVTKAIESDCEPAKELLAS